MVYFYIIIFLKSHQIHRKLQEQDQETPDIFAQIPKFLTCLVTVSALSLFSLYVCIIFVNH